MPARLPVRYSGGMAKDKKDHKKKDKKVKCICGRHEFCQCGQAKRKGKGKDKDKKKGKGKGKKKDKK